MLKNLAAINLARGCRIWRNGQIDWSKAPHFSQEELLVCKCGRSDCYTASGMPSVDVPPEHTAQMLYLLEYLRKDVPLRINSGYRCPNHPIEARKSYPGAHSDGLAVDIGVSGIGVMPLLFDVYCVNRLMCESASRLEAGGMASGIAKWQGITVGIQQKGDYVGRFVHIGLYSAAAPLLLPDGNCHVYSY